MSLIQLKTNPKALNLESLDLDGNKVTVGFKCEPKIKLELANAATLLGVTLSEFMETLVLEFKAGKHANAAEKEDMQGLVAFYENDILKSICEKYKGQEIKFTAADGNAMEVTVNSPKDIYTIIINSFKIQP